MQDKAKRSDERKETCTWGTIRCTHPQALDASMIIQYHTLFRAVVSQNPERPSGHIYYSPSPDPKNNDQ
jgi:hypothetical protein